MSKSLDDIRRYAESVKKCDPTPAEVRLSHCVLLLCDVIEQRLDVEAEREVHAPEWVSA